MKMIKIFIKAARSLTEYPLLLMILIGVFIFASAIGLKYIKIDNSISNWFNPNSKVWLEYTEFRDTFGSDDLLTIFYSDEDIFSKEALSLHSSLSSRLASLSNVKRVISLTEIKVPVLMLNQLVLVPIIDTSDTSFDVLQSKLLRQDILIDNIISKDGKATAITLLINDPENDNTVTEIKRILAEDTYSKNDYYLANNVPIRHEMNRLSQWESLKFLIACAIILILLLYLRFRSVSMALIPLIAALVSVLITLGLFALLGKSLNMISVAIPLILMVISIATSVHIIVRARHINRRNSSRREAIKESIRQVFTPCIFSNLTTALAFLAFTVSDMQPIRLFGIWSSSGIIISFVINFTLLPFLYITFNPVREPKSESHLNLNDILFTKLFNTITKYRKLIFATIIALITVSVLGISMLEVETDQINYFKTSNPIRRANEVAKEHFEGIIPIELIIRNDDSGTEDFLGFINELEIEIESIKNVTSCHTPVDALNTIRDLMNVQIDQNVLSSIILSDTATYNNDSNNLLRSYLSDSGNMARISIKMPWMNNEDIWKLISDINQILSPYFTDTEKEYYITGFIPIFNTINKRLMSNLIKSLSLSFVLIFIMLLVLFKKISLAIFGMIPNIIPVLLSLGIMGLSGVRIDVMTVLISSISLGIAVDDTIHFLNAYINNDQSDKSNFGNRIISVYRRIFEPVSLTSLILICGFSILLFSSYVPLIYFGLFISLNILLAYVLDLVLLPAVLSINKKLTR